VNILPGALAIHLFRHFCSSAVRCVI